MLVLEGIYLFRASTSQARNHALMEGGAGNVSFIRSFSKNRKIPGCRAGNIALFLGF